MEISLKPQFIDFPPKMTELIRSMEVGQSINITHKNRNSIHSLAIRTLPEAGFKTRKYLGKIYLVRTA